MTTVVQPCLPLRIQAYPIDREKIVTLPNFKAAMDLSLTLCGFESDKDASRILQIDSGAFSSKKNDTKPWNVPEMRRVMERGRHLIPLAWLANQYGHGLVLLESEAERRERELRDENNRLRMEKQVLIDALHGRAA